LKRCTLTGLWNNWNICLGGGRGGVNGTCNVISRSQWPYGLRHRSMVWVLRSRTRIPLRVWMFVCCVLCMLYRQRTLRRAGLSFTRGPNGCVM
jgi:hypothetical protein